MQVNSFDGNNIISIFYTEGWVFLAHERDKVYGGTWWLSNRFFHCWIQTDEKCIYNIMFRVLLQDHALIFKLIQFLKDSFDSFIIYCLN